MGYGDTTARAHHIPAAAITLEDADMLHRIQNRGQPIRVTLSMEAHMVADAHSRNVMGEVRGTEHPDEIIVLGGHIDSWDVGQGAMDDGGGIVAAWEAVRLIKQLGLKPKRTIRVVGWVNEEMGGRGAQGVSRRASRGGAEDEVRDGVGQRRVHAEGRSTHGAGLAAPGAEAADGAARAHRRDGGERWAIPRRT